MKKIFVYITLSLFISTATVSAFAKSKSSYYQEVKDEKKKDKKEDKKETSSKDEKSSDKKCDGKTGKKKCCSSKKSCSHESKEDKAPTK